MLTACSSSHYLLMHHPSHPYRDPNTCPVVQKKQPYPYPSPYHDIPFMKMLVFSVVGVLNLFVVFVAGVLTLFVVFVAGVLIIGQHYYCLTVSATVLSQT